MKTFKEYLLEATTVVQQDATPYVNAVALLRKWFDGDYMAMDQSTFSSSQQKLVDAFKLFTDYIKPANFGPSTLYRVFPEDHLKQFLSDSDVKKSESYTQGDKKRFYNAVLKGKNVDLSTGIKEIQSWTESLSSVKTFHRDIHFHQKQHEWFFLVKSSFSDSEKLFYYGMFTPIIDKLNDFDYTTTKLNQKWHDVLFDFIYLRQSYENQKETVVDTHQPREVEILEVTNPLHA